VENRRLKLFVAVAEELHFTRASVRLRIAQPHLSQEIRRLEREIGVELFTRTKRSVSLTPAGSVFLERVRIVLDYTADAMRAAQRASRGEVGRIRVGFTRVPAIGVIPDAIVRFRSAYPDVEVLLKDVSSDEGLEAVRTGHLDLCLLHPPRTADSALNIETIWLEPLVALLPPKHPNMATVRSSGCQCGMFLEPGANFDRYTYVPDFVGSPYSTAVSLLAAVTTAEAALRVHGI
jgi:DNA-binding transcriptional LysR family regulator